MPEVAITSDTRKAPKRRSAFRNSRAINCFMRASSSSEGDPGKKFFGQTDRAQRQAHRFLDAFPFGERDLTTAATDIDQQTSALGAGFAHHPAVNQARFFQAGDDLHFPTGFGFDPGRKACALRASRNAEVATARTWSALCSLTAR